MSDWRELTETHGMTAGTPDAIDRLIDRYNETEYRGPACVECGEACGSWDSGFEFDRGHYEFYVILGIAPEEYDEVKHPSEIFVPLHGNCYESATGNYKMRDALLKRIRAWYYGE